MVDFQRRSNRTRVRLTAVGLPAVAFLVVLAVQSRVEVSYLTRDPAETMETHSYIGLVSNLGILGWCAAAAVSIFAASVLRRREGGRDAARFLLVSGLLSLGFLFDDLLMLHERFAPNRLGIPQPVTAGAYAAAILAYLVYFRHVIRTTDFTLLGCALGCMACSVILDVVRDISHAFDAHILEDGAKFLGIVLWAAYLIFTAGDTEERLPRL